MPGSVCHLLRGPAALEVGAMHRGGEAVAGGLPCEVHPLGAPLEADGRSEVKAMLRGAGHSIEGIGATGEGVLQKCDLVRWAS